jgi:hypothetical protein
MKVIISIFIFCIILFLYLHIFFHIKTSDDLEVYEIDRPSKEKLEEICDLRQPVVFDFEADQLNTKCSLQQVIKDYGAFDIKMRNVKEEQSDNELYIPILLQTANEAFLKDQEKKYLSERNSDFLEETGLVKYYRYNDSFLRPHMVSSCDYDFMVASKDLTTPLRYELSYRNYFLVTQGEVIIKLIPPKATKYLYPIKDYENFEFNSPINPWDVQKQYQSDYDKVKSLEVKLTKGNIIYIPAYWWYSINFLSSETSICNLKYKTYMNTIAILPQLIMKFLQQQNIKRNIVKIKEYDFSTDISNLSNTITDESENNK